MRPLGLILIVLGVVALIYTGFTFTSKEPIIEAGPIEISKEKKHNVSWPPIAGAVLIGLGIVLVVVDKKK